MRRPAMVLALAGAMLAAAPALAQAQTDYEAGVAARLAGDPAKAKRLLAAWVAQHPSDADARLQLAYADLALGNLDEAEAGFEAVLRLAPDYTDARSGLAQVMQRRQTPGGETRGQILLEGALSDLSGSAPGWSELALDAEAPLGANATMGGRIAHYRRFDLDDFEVTARFGLHPRENLWLRAHAGGAHGADFRPEIEVGAGADLRVTGGSNATVLTLDTAFQRFPLQEVFSVQPGVVRYLNGGRSWLTLRGIGTVADGGPLQVGGSLRGDHVPAEGWRAFAGLSNGPDTDLGVVTRVTSLFGGIEAPLGERFGVVGSIGHDWRETGFDRTEMRVALRARF